MYLSDQTIDISRLNCSLIEWSFKGELTCNIEHRIKFEINYKHLKKCTYNSIFKNYFQVFSIAGPQTGTTDTAATTSGGAFGTCYRDTFSLSSGGNLGSPIICGYNTGQHSM